MRDLENHQIQERHYKLKLRFKLRGIGLPKKRNAIIPLRELLGSPSIFSGTPSITCESSILSFRKFNMD